MKIIHVINSLSIGGAEKMLLDICQEMNKIDGLLVDVVIISSDFTGFYDEYIRHGINVFSLPFKNKFDLPALYRLYNLIKDYNIIHSHLFPCNYYVSILSLFLNKSKLITTEHSSYNKRRRIFILRPLEKLIYSRYNIIIAISDATKKNLIHWVGYEDKIIVTPNGIDLKSYSSEDNSHNSMKKNNKTFMLMMIGSFSEQKDQDTIVRSLKYLPENIKLALVGDGKRINIVQSLALELQLQHRIEFLGKRDDVPKLISNADIVILSSHWEGFGLAALEGMATGKPVIASDVPGLNELVKDAGLIFPASNDKELASLINQLYTSDEFYISISKKCLERAQNFSIDKLVLKYLDIYRGNL
ncbi:glycosyltransferase [Providencia rettgeri]|uniref:glycosyltransferase n=1 Tax=Providencia rettgeri TaxID=587 RepID=UPI00352643CD